MFQIESLKIICTDSTEIFFSKLRSVGLNYHLPKTKFFTDPYCVGVSHKHFLLTCFISFKNKFQLVFLVILFHVMGWSASHYAKRISDECSCFIEFIKRVGEKR